MGAPDAPARPGDEHNASLAHPAQRRPAPPGILVGGCRLMTTLLHELERTGGRYGLQTMCEGGGQANVTILERL